MIDQFVLLVIAHIISEALSRCCCCFIFMVASITFDLIQQPASTLFGCLTLTSACTSLPLSFELLLCFLAFFFSPRGLNSIPGSFALIIMQMGRCQQIFDTFDTLTCLCLPQKHLMKSNTFSISIVLPETEIAIFCSLDRFPLQVLLTMVEVTLDTLILVKLKLCDITRLQ